MGGGREGVTEWRYLFLMCWQEVEEQVIVYPDGTFAIHDYVRVPAFRKLSDVWRKRPKKKEVVL